MEMTKQLFHYTVGELTPLIDWAYFFHAWQVKGDSAQGRELKADALARLGRMAATGGADALYCRVEARSEGDNLLLSGSVRLPLLRQQHLGQDGFTLCLADFVSPKGDDAVGLFATTCPLQTPADGDPYESLMVQTLATRLAEAAAEKLDRDIAAREGRTGRTAAIRPAVGYPCLPDLSVIFLLDELLGMSTIGITLTENGAMSPPSSVCGLMIDHPAARYFAVGRISEEQFDDYTRRRGIEPTRMRQFLRAVL